MADHRLPLMTRARKELNLIKMIGARRFGYFFIDLGERCLRLAKSKPKAGSSRAPAAQRSARSIVAWRQFIAQLGNPAVVRALVDGTGFGRDLPRDISPVPGGRILVLAAHQDDETLGAGGTLILASRAGKKIRVVYHTDGATAFSNFPLEEAVKLRRDEATRVWGQIAGIQPEFLDHPNRGDQPITDTPTRLAEIIDEFRPTDIFVPSFLEQVAEHSKMSELLVRTHEVTPIPADTEIWGYQITTHAAGNTIIDITPVIDEKRMINKMWESQNVYGDYDHLSIGRDIVAAIHMKGNRPRRLGGYAESFLKFNSERYISLCRLIFAPQKKPQPPKPNFFVIGLQKSGTFWLTALLDSHPQIRCFPERVGHPDGTGEAHLFDSLAKIDDYNKFKKAFSRRLEGYFFDLLPKQAPTSHDERQNLIQSLCDRFDEYCHWQRLRHGKPVVGEKTTETCHHPDLLNELYPDAVRIVILRDPRDRTVSFFYDQKRKNRLSDDAEINDQFIDDYIERVVKDYENLLLIEGQVEILTYEGLSNDPLPIVKGICARLGVTSDVETISAMINSARFENLSGRETGTVDEASHFRKGIVGDWREMLTIEQADRIIARTSELTLRIESKFEINLTQYR